MQCLTRHCFIMFGCKSNIHLKRDVCRADGSLMDIMTLYWSKSLQLYQHCPETGHECAVGGQSSKQ